MNKLQIVAPILLLSLPALAQGSLEGSWKLALGKKAPCEVQMTADGAVTPGTDCPTDIARWKGTSNGVQLQTASGETYAVLKPKGSGFEGATFADSRSVTLTR
jgi:Protease inhibitor Inh